MHKSTSRRHAKHNNYDLYRDFENFKSVIANTASDLRGKAGEMVFDSVEGIKNKSSELHDNLAEYTSEQPLKSMGIALAVGFFLGYLMHRR